MNNETNELAHKQESTGLEAAPYLGNLSIWLSKKTSILLKWKDLQILKSTVF